MVMINTVPTVQRILDVSQQLLQMRGYNSFDYGDISQAIGVNTTIIHEYFPVKSDLAKALVVRYRHTFYDLEANIDRSTNHAIRKLEAFADLYLDGLRSGRVCLCGMMAEDINTLPPDVREEVRAFFNENEAWLVKVMSEGIEAGLVRLQGAIEVEAQLLMIGLQGAQLTARTYNDLDRFRRLAKRLIAGVTA
jgi:TetR/AcrR family transcriptional regulator, transcriptional repressor for nem operon